MDSLNSKHSFAWLNVTQFFGALNDNVFKLLVIFFLVDHLGMDRKSTIALASLVFVVPFLLFSQVAGVLADRFSKQKIIFYTKCSELVLMVAGFIGILLSNPNILYSLLFLMCAQSAFFGPSKFGIIPELVKQEELSKANSFMVGLTYLAIILGTFMPSLFLVTLFSESYIALATLCIVISALGLISSHRIGHTAPVGSTQQKISPFFFVEIFKTLRSLRHDRYLFYTLISIAYFLFLGAFIQQNLLLYGPEEFGWNTRTSGYLFPMAAVGIALGALFAGKISGRCIEFGLVPIGAAGLSLSCLLLGLLPPSIPFVLLLVCLIGLSSGVFIVPLQSFIQQRSPRERLGETLACMNYHNFLGVAVSAVLFIIMTKTFGITAKQCFLINGLMTAVLAIATFSVLPDFIIRFLILILTRTIYRIDTHDIENIPRSGGALLVSIRASWADALLISATQQRRIRFILESKTYNNRWLSPLFRLMQTIPMSTNVSQNETTARNAMDDGYMVCVFLENSPSEDSSPMKIENTLPGSTHPVIPIHVGGTTTRIQIPRSKISVTVGPPLPSTTTIESARRAISELVNPE